MPEGQSVPGGSVDSGLLCLTLISRFFQLSLNPDQIRHDYGKTEGPFDAIGIVRCAKRAGMLARLSKSNWSRLGKVPLPAIAELNPPDAPSRSVIFARTVEDKLLIQDPAQSAPELKTEAEIRRNMKWFDGREDSPWYPSATLFRQPRPDCWPEVIEAVKIKLSNGERHR